MDENTFLEQFEAGILHPFHHYDHIHMAWLYLRRNGWEKGYTQIQNGLKHFATAHGHATRYHETITRFWAHLIQHTIDERPDIDDFEIFVAVFPMLLDPASLKKHYSAELLNSDVARQSWQEPDSIPLPILE